MPSYHDNEAARALASPTENRHPQQHAPYTDSDFPLSNSSRSSSPTNHTYRTRLNSTASKLHQNTISTYRGAMSTYRSLSILQRVLLFVAGVLSLVVLGLFIRFGEGVFVWIEPLATRWREQTGGWAILWAATFVVSFPPLIGYSSCVTIAGFVFGVWKGWLIVASASILGSTASFLVSRHFLSSFTRRLASSPKFAALSSVLSHDGLKLLIMIRLCPLPYSISNGALSAFPSVAWQTFMLASTIASPKLFIHVFVGSRLAKIAGDVDRMEPRDKWVNWASVGLSVCLGAAVAWYIYGATKRRAAELQAMERAEEGRADGNGRGSRTGNAGAARPSHELDDPENFENFGDDEDEEDESEADEEHGKTKMQAQRQIPKIRVERFRDEE